MLWGRRRIGESVQAHKQEIGETEREGNMRFQALTIFDNPDEWRRVLSEIDSTATAEFISLKNIPGFDMLETW